MISLVQIYTIIPFLLRDISKPGVSGLSILHNDEPQIIILLNKNEKTYAANLSCKLLIVFDCSFTTISNV